MGRDSRAVMADRAARDKGLPQAEADELAAEVRRALEALEEDGADKLFDEIYAEPHQELERQRREHALYLQQFDDEEAGA